MSFFEHRMVSVCNFMIIRLSTLYPHTDNTMTFLLTVLNFILYTRLRGSLVFGL